MLSAISHVEGLIAGYEDMVREDRVIIIGIDGVEV